VKGFGFWVLDLSGFKGFKFMYIGFRVEDFRV